VDFTADDVASLLKRLFSEAGSAELARVESALDETDNERVPRLDAMSRSLDALYRRFGIDPASPIDAASPEVQKLLATSLDGSLFRSEMVRFADEIAQLRQGLEHERGEYARASTEMKHWIDKLQADVSALQAQLTAESQARAAAQGQLFEQGKRIEALEAIRVQYENIPRIVRRLFRKRRDGRG